MTQGVEKQVRILPAIEAERHFVEVGRKMVVGQFPACPSFGRNLSDCQRHTSQKPTSGQPQSARSSVAPAPP